MVDKELWSLVSSIIRFLAGFVINILGYFLMVGCVVSFYLGTDILNKGIDPIHMGVAGICLFLVGESMLRDLSNEGRINNA